MQDTEVAGPGPDPGEGAALAARLGVSRYDLEVAQVVELTPTLRRIVLGADGLDRFAHVPGQDIMLTVDPAPGAAVRRRYTIRGHDRDSGTVAVHIVVHGNGPGSRWAAAAAPGTRIEGIGPRGKITLAADVDWHLFVGDETFVPAAYAMLEAAPSAARAVAVFVVGSSVDERPLTPAITAVVGGPTWVHRGTTPTVPDLLAVIDLPVGTGQAYVGGEARLVRDVRRALLDRGLDDSRIAHKAYWRADGANARHGEPERLDA